MKILVFQISFVNSFTAAAAPLYGLINYRNYMFDQIRNKLIYGENVTCLTFAVPGEKL